MSCLLDLHREMVEGHSRRVGTVLLLFMLAPLAWIYGLVNRIRVLSFQNGLRSVYRCRASVVSVGNLTVGGTGKTPMVDFLVRFWLEQGKRVAVVSRGYKGEGGHGVQLVSVDSPVEVVGDEPLLLAKRNPEAVVIVARKRRIGVEQAVEHHQADVVILDDGFQHLQVDRDMDIVLLDAARPFGNGLPLPAGNLREFPSALKRADILIHTRSADHDSCVAGFTGPQFHSSHRLDNVATRLEGGSIPLEELSGKRIVAFAGIANPDKFFQALVGVGIELAARIPFPDHVRYTQNLLDRLFEEAGRADYLLTTEKDGVKLQPKCFPVPCLTVGMTLDFGSFREQLIEVVKKLEVRNR
ncbi:MAG: tetraacyldisaccharide 4'-kinase [Desulfuromonas sp.]|nr:MAG: tetraacyldisaccharide 4'-kinase [Desulfuromonas sp.]